jgi:hypothetical protein
MINIHGVCYVRHTHRLQCHRFRPEDRSNPFQAILSYWWLKRSVNCSSIHVSVNFRKIGDLQKSKKRLFSDKSNITSILETIPLRVYVYSVTDFVQKIGQTLFKLFWVTDDWNVPWTAQKSLTYQSNITSILETIPLRVYRNDSFQKVNRWCLNNIIMIVKTCKRTWQSQEKKSHK